MQSGRMRFMCPAALVTCQKPTSLAIIVNVIVRIKEMCVCRRLDDASRLATVTGSETCVIPVEFAVASGLQHFHVKSALLCSDKVHVELAGDN